MEGCGGDLEVGSILRKIEQRDVLRPISRRRKEGRKKNLTPF